MFGSRIFHFLEFSTTYKAKKASTSYPHLGAFSKRHSQGEGSFSEACPSVTELLIVELELFTD